MQVAILWKIIGIGCLMDFDSHLQSMPLGLLHLLCSSARWQRKMCLELTNVTIAACLASCITRSCKA